MSLRNRDKSWAALWRNQQSECAPSEDSEQPGHSPSLIRGFTVRMKKAWTLSYPLSAQGRLWSDWGNAQADLSLCWAHSHIVGFVTRQLICMILLHAVRNHYLCAIEYVYLFKKVQPLNIYVNWTEYIKLIHRPVRFFVFCQNQTTCSGN